MREFTHDWFSPHVEALEKDTRHLAGKHKLRIIEIGCYEGMGTCWFLEHLATNNAEVICIDTFQGGYDHKRFGVPFDGVKSRFLKNIGSAFSESVYLMEKESHEALRELRLIEGGYADLIYVDGSHLAADVLEDAVLGWRLLKQGGIMIFDDYEWHGFEDPTLCPKQGIDAFLAGYDGKYDLVRKDYRVTLRKR